MSKALFLDRDGVVNRDFGYVHKPDNFEFIPGIFELCRVAQARGFVTIIITNQAGIARGLYSEWEFARLTNWMTGRFFQEGCPIAAVYYCPFHAEAGTGSYARSSDERKPAPGMFLRAGRDFSLELRHCIALGDKRSDMLAAEAAGVGTRILLASRDSLERGAEHHVVDNLHDATRFIRSDAWPFGDGGLRPR